MLQLPISVQQMNRLINVLDAIYGSGLTMQENPAGWLDFRTPRLPND